MAEGAILALHRHIDLGNDLSLGALLPHTQPGVSVGHDVDDEVAVRDALEVHAVVPHPTALSRQRDTCAEPGVGGIDVCGLDLVGGRVAVYLDALGGLVDAYATHGGLHLWDGAVGIEGELLDADRAALVILGREEIGVVEQVPLPLIFHQTVMVGPASVGVLGHDDALEIPRSEGRFRHGVGQCLGAALLSYPGESEVVPVAPAESKGTFLEAFGQTFHLLPSHFHGRHFGHAFALRHLHLLQFAVQLLHVRLQFGPTYAHAAPVEIGLPVVVDEHAGVDAADTLDGFGLQYEGTFGIVGNSHTNREPPAVLGAVGEIEIVFAVLLHAVWRPHGVAVGLSPGHFLLRDDDTVVSPVCQVLRGEYVIVGHAEPVLALAGRGNDVVRRIEINFAIEYASRWVG